MAVRREVTWGHSRFDFALDTDERHPTLVEVKSVTLVEGGIGRFPDAPTQRGARHVRELTRWARGGRRALVLFSVQRDDARYVCPNPVTDPELTDALAGARQAGVLVRAVQFRLHRDGAAEYLGPLPFRMRRGRSRR